MFWSHDIPHQITRDAAGRSTEVAVIAGRLAEAGAPLAPPPDSWAAKADSDVSIWTLRMDPGASWILPAAAGVSTQRSLYFFKGRSVSVDGENIQHHAALELRGDCAVALVNTGSSVAEFLLLQGKPIAEPVVQYGPFVMNTTSAPNLAVGLGKTALRYMAVLRSVLRGIRTATKSGLWRPAIKLNWMRASSTD
jgi:redox-sensitive bicupin YhaK (pirin superfamily)